MHVILAHSHTDFDGLAAQYAAGRLYPDAYVVLAPQLYATVAEFVGLYRDVLQVVEQADLPDQPVARFTLVDTDRIWGTWQTHAELQTVIIDHHTPATEPYPDQTHHVSTHTGATTTLLVQRMLDAGLAINPVEATLFALGIYEDTGNLTYAATTSTDVYCVAALLEHGADLKVLRRYRERALTLEQQLVYQVLLEQLHAETIHGWQVLTAWADLDQSIADLSSLVEHVRDLYQPAVLVVALGLGNGTQLIARADEAVLDAGALMDEWGGGGHGAAAAAWVAQSQPQSVWYEVRHQIRERIRPAQQASDIMSTSLITLTPESTVGEALELLRRWDYGALPVLDQQQQLLGDLGRAELSKAERHQLLEAPVRRYMWRKPTTIAPDLALNAVRQQVAHDVRGRVYVVDAHQRVQGIITRGDILHHTELHSRTATPDYLEQFKARISAAMWQRVAWAAEWAAQHQWGTYVVGGFVRDLLLDRPAGDLDLVVEGRAIDVAEALAAATHATVRTHPPFGTATVTWEAEDQLDFITARTEFYEHPTALPQVEAASLRHDLHRRDFTINTLALALSPPHQGQLYDFYGAVRDLERKRIRVLHNLSFIDDPTRVLRALRLAGRLDFQIEARTGELLHDALDQDVLGRTTPARIFHELERMLQEPQAATMFKLCAEWGVLSKLHPDFVWNEKLSTHFTALEQFAWSSVERAAARLLMLLQPLEPAARSAWAQQYTLPSLYRSLIAQWSHLNRLQDEGQKQLSPGELDTLLAPFDTLVLQLLALVEPATAEQITMYLARLRSTPSLLSGHHLRDQLHVKPGPHYARILAQARQAQLNGAFDDPEGALRWAQIYLNKEDK